MNLSTQKAPPSEALYFVALSVFQLHCYLPVERKKFVVLAQVVVTGVIHWPFFAKRAV